LSKIGEKDARGRPGAKDGIASSGGTRRPGWGQERNKGKRPAGCVRPDAKAWSGKNGKKNRSNHGARPDTALPAKSNADEGPIREGNWIARRTNGKRQKMPVVTKKAHGHQTKGKGEGERKKRNILKVFPEAS